MAAKDILGLILSGVYL